MAPDGTKDAPSSQQRPAPADLRSLHLWHLQPVRDLLVIAAVAGTVYAGYAMRTVTVPLLVALALAYLFEPIVSRVASWRRMNRPLAVGLILSGLGLGMAIALLVLVPLSVGQALSFGESLRSGRYDTAISRVVALMPDEYREDVRAWTDKVVHPSSRSEPRTEPHTESRDAAPHVEPDGHKPAPAEAAPSTQSPAAEPAPSRAATEEPPTILSEVTLDNPLIALIGTGSREVYLFLLKVLQIGLVIFLIPFYFYYFSVYWPSILGFFSMLIPDDRREKVLGIVQEMDRAVAGFVRGRIVIAVIMGVLMAIGWQICGVPYGIVLGILAGAFSIVPYLGGIALPCAIGLLVADQFSMEESARMSLWAMLLWPSLVFVLVQTLEGYVLTPVIAGKATNLDPVTIVVAILAGGSVAGVYGMLLAIPIAACGKIAAKRLLLPRITEWARGRASDPLPLDRR